MKIHRDLMTEDDANTTWDPLRIAFLLTVVIAQSLIVYSVVALGKDFDVQSYCIGMGTLIGVTGVGLWASSKQAPS
jgi:hypothetical protein